MACKASNAKKSDIRPANCLARRSLEKLQMPGSDPKAQSRIQKKRSIRYEKMIVKNVRLETLLSGSDLRTLGKSGVIISKIKDQKDFDELFDFIFHPERTIVMRAADVVEKITLHHPDFLTVHKDELLALLHQAANKELQWHIAILVTRVELNEKEVQRVWNKLKSWANNSGSARIVRVASLQGLYEITKKKPRLLKSFLSFAEKIEKEEIPSINARMRHIRKEIAVS